MGGWIHYVIFDMIIKYLRIYINVDMNDDIWIFM